jgi:hypothetical protein
MAVDADTQHSETRSISRKKKSGFAQLLWESWCPERELKPQGAKRRRDLESEDSLLQV